MESSAATRVWRVCKAAGRSFPRVSDDDVIDFLVTEAVYVKASREDQEAAKQQGVENWKQGHNDLRQKLS